MKRLLLPLGVLLCGVLISGGVVAFAQTEAAAVSAEAKISFPVPELGNCADKAACRAYCADAANMEACTAFAEAHGLVNKEEAARAQKFARTLKAAGGPGGCKSPAECKQFCSTLVNLEACVKFAEEQGVNDEHLASAKKVRQFVQGGGTLPGGCTSKESCELYCQDFSHAEECTNFAARAGLAVRADGDVPPGQFQKFVALAKEGKTPGICKSKQECERYCRQESHFEECANFAADAGLVTAPQAEKLKQNGRRGPGGCDSEAACKAYCNDATHREECFSFAKDNGLVSAERLNRAEEGMVRLRQGLDSAPAPVAACLKASVGGEVIESVQSGTLVPSPEVGDRVKGCFEKFGSRSDPAEAVRKLPRTVLTCAREKLGEAFAAVEAGTASSTPEIADAMRVCAQSAQLTNASGTPAFRTKVLEVIRSAPPEVSVCIKEKLGGQTEALANGTAELSMETEAMLKTCFQAFRPQPPRVKKEETGSGKAGAPGMGQPLVECLRTVTGSADTPTASLDASTQEKIRRCAEDMRPGSGGFAPKPDTARSSGTRSMPVLPKPPAGLNFSPEAMECVRAAVGDEVLLRIAAGDTASLDIAAQVAIKACAAKGVFNPGTKPGEPGVLKPLPASPPRPILPRQGMVPAPRGTNAGGTDSAETGASATTGETSAQ